MRFFAIVQREYLERVRSKWFVIATLFGPLFLGAVMVVPLWLGVRSAATAEQPRISILDATGTELGARIADRLSGGVLGDTTTTTVIRVSPAELAAAESTATRAVMDGEVSGFLVLRPTAAMDTILRYAGRNAAFPLDMQRVERAARDGMLTFRLERQGVRPDVVLGVMQIPLSVATEQITERGRGGSGRIRFIFAGAIALMLYIAILVHGQSVLRGVLEEKTTRVAEVVVASVRPEVLLGGKVIGIGAVGLTQIVVWILSGLAMARWRAPIMRAVGLPGTPLDLPEITASALVLLALFFLLGFVLYAAVFAAVGGMVSSEQEAQQAAQPLMLIVFAPLILMQPVLMNPTTGLSRAASWIPFSAPILMPLRLSLVPVPASEIAISLVASVIACGVAVWVAARIYRVGVLMYGKRATLREVARWVMR
jgi:ABC-2 type transport system permease protein